MKTLLYTYRYALLHEIASLIVLFFTFTAFCVPHLSLLWGEPFGGLKTLGFYFGGFLLLLFSLLWADEAWYTGLNELFCEFCED